MTGALDIRFLPGRGAEIRAEAGLPVAALVIGRPVEAVADLLPRLFNLCAAAQGAAARLALGLPPGPADLGHEIRREHLMRLCLSCPQSLGPGVGRMPAGWAEATPRALRKALFGPAAQAPGPADFGAWLESGLGLAPILAGVAHRFAPGEAVADLAPVRPDGVMTPRGQDNSCAARVADHPLMGHVAGAWGRGPLWRALGRALDLDACLEVPPLATRLPDGTALAPAARGTYGLCARVEGGLVTALTRVTPTDHLIAPGGVLEQSLSSLPADKAGLARLVIDILDPCVPAHLTLAEVAHA
ncbi:hypothetical protein [Phaeovulum vinaykumarii]|uniref:Hydrogenase expression/formation protein HupK n=1 Tax=Phaeovulum vinaykumarii TaxID=407234 RepID=A0A1N7LA12_9RHOB|nr:hypothetical protein [Phaeovulum vinaykumarii]SIS70692.1 hypothetical protein SAMN05421795_102743 [Phaeovulum vinaykumarii]SOB98768.1 hypothetical protein SAMN05878426_10229 [Phaeovulum vinaykumarii]